MQKKSSNFVSGFTLIELLAAILIISLLGGIGVVGYKRYFDVGKSRYYRTLESSVLLAGNDYFLDHRDELPSENYVSEVPITALVQGKYLEDVNDSKGNSCDSSKVYAYLENNKYNYEPCLICDDGYRSHGKYCNGELIDTINAVGKTKNTNQPINVTASYNNVISAIRENVLVDLSINNTSLTVSRYDVINEKTKVTVPCSVLDNMCTAEIEESGTYGVKAYNEENKLIASRVINVRIINQDDGYITLEANSGSIDYGTGNKIINVANHHGGTLTAVSNNEAVSCAVNGMVVTCSNLSNLNAETNIRVTVTSGETDEYTEASAVYNLSIERAAGSFVCSNKTYNGASQTGCTCSGGTLSGTTTGTTYSATAKTAYCTPDNNHTINGSTERQTATWYINKKNLTITAKKQTIREGNSISTTTGDVTASGLVSGDSITGITLSGSRTTAGKGTITPSAGTTSKGIGNYNVTYTKGDLIIYLQASSKITGAASGTVSFTGINTIVKDPWIKDERGTISFSKSGTKVTCNVTSIPKNTATTDNACEEITGNSENFYYNGSCYYRAGATPSFTGNSWACGSKTNPLKGSGNHCPNNSSNCSASDCWNAIKYAFNPSAVEPYKCKCWGKVKNWVYYDAVVYIRYY